MSAMVFLALTTTCLVIGVASVLNGRRARTKVARLRCAKIAVGAFGSLAVVLGVKILAELLPLLVVLFAVFWLTRHLRAGTSPVVRFIDKQIAKTS